MRVEQHRRLSEIPITFPVILIAGGLLLLLNNLGMLPAGAASSVWRLWPVVLLLIGVEIIVHRLPFWPNWASIIVVLLAVGALVGIVSDVPATYGYPWSLYQQSNSGIVAGPTNSGDISAPLEGARQASVTLTLSAGDLQLDGANNERANAIEGTYIVGTSRPAPIKTVRLESGRLDYALKTNSSGDGTSFPLAGNAISESWNLHLSRDLPTELKLTMNASQGKLDLSGVRITNLDTKVNASSVALVMPAEGSVQSSIKVSAGSAEVTIPSQVAARIYVHSSLSGVQIDETRFPKNGDYYQSPGFDSATNRANITLDVSVGSVAIR
jgi:hypothetical protein